MIESMADRERDLELSFPRNLSVFAVQAQETHAIRRRLRQDRVWVDREGREHLVAEMSARHAANVIRFLERRAGWIYDGECSASIFVVEPHGEQAGFAFEDEMQRLHEAEPVEWLHEQSLVRALRERAGETKPGPSASWLAKHPVIAAKVALRRLHAP